MDRSPNVENATDGRERPGRDVLFVNMSHRSSTAIAAGSRSYEKPKAETGIELLVDPGLSKRKLFGRTSYSGHHDFKPRTE